MGLREQLVGPEEAICFRGILVGAATAAIGTGVLHDMGVSATSFADKAIHTAGHGIVGGAANVALGGKFQDGFLSAVAGVAAGHAGVYQAFEGTGVWGRTAVAGIVGGTASAIGGGKFANGAYTAAFMHFFNEESGGFWDKAKEIYMDANRGAAVFMDTINPFGNPYKDKYGWYTGKEDWYGTSKGFSNVGAVSLTGATLATGNPGQVTGLLYSGTATVNSANKTIRVIGNLKDTAHYVNKGGYSVFTTNSYSIMKNIRWIHEGVKAGAPFKVVTPRTFA